jgi:hypothetical protein
MNTTRLKLASIVSLTAAAAALLVAACGSFSGQVAAAGPASDIPGAAGTWLVTVTPVATGVSFQSTVVYTRDGAVIEATSRPFVAPTADTSEGLGVWSQTGASVHVTFQKYLFNSQGIYIGRTVIADTDTLDHQGNSFSGNAVATFFDAQGNILTRLASSTSGRRMTLAA